MGMQVLKQMEASHAEWLQTAARHQEDNGDLDRVRARAQAAEDESASLQRATHDLKTQVTATRHLLNTTTKKSLKNVNVCVMKILPLQKYVKPK